MRQALHFARRDKGNKVSVNGDPHFQQFSPVSVIF